MTKKQKIGRDSEKIARVCHWLILLVVFGLAEAVGVALLDDVYAMTGAPTPSSLALCVIGAAGIILCTRALFDAVASHPDQGLLKLPAPPPFLSVDFSLLNALHAFDQLAVHYRQGRRLDAIDEAVLQTRLTALNRQAVRLLH